MCGEGGGCGGGGREGGGVRGFRVCNTLFEDVLFALGVNEIRCPAADLSTSTVSLKVLC